MVGQRGFSTSGRAGRESEDTLVEEMSCRVCMDDVETVGILTERHMVMCPSVPADMCWVNTPKPGQSHFNALGDLKAAQILVDTAM